MNKLEINYLKTDDLKPYEKNTKLHPDEQVKHIASSIEDFGFRQPIVIDKNNIIIIGHGRWMASKHLGLEKIPCVYADDLTEQEIKALRLADNKTNESEWDFDLLDSELDAILDLDMSDYGFDLNFDEGEMKIDDAPDEFKEYGEDLETKHVCPRCRYEW